LGGGIKNKLEKTGFGLYGAVALMPCFCIAGDSQYFHDTQETTGIVFGTRKKFWIGGTEFAHEFCASEGNRELLFEFPVDGRIRWGQVGPVNQGSGIESGTADQDGRPAPLVYFPENTLCVSEVALEIITLVNVYNVDKMVWYALAKCGRRFGCACVEAAVDLHRVAGYDFRPQAFGKFDSDVGFSRAGRSQHCKGMHRPVLEAQRRNHFCRDSRNVDKINSAAPQVIAESAMLNAGKFHAR